MKKITKEYEVYDFEELDKDIQEKLIEEEKESEKEFYIDNCLEDDMKYYAEELLIKYFGDADFQNVYYDLSYSQGSGAMIRFIINIEDLNKKYNFLSKEELRFIQDKGIVNDIEVYHNDNFYCHEYSFDIRYNDNFGYYDYEDIKGEYNINEEDYNKLEDKIINFLDTYNKVNTPCSKFIEDIIDMNRELKYKGYELIEEEINDADAIEFLKEQEYLKNGDVF